MFLGFESHGSHFSFLVLAVIQNGQKHDRVNMANTKVSSTWTGIKNFFGVLQISRFSNVWLNLTLHGLNHISYKIILPGGIKEFDCMWTFDCMWGWKIIAYKSKINIFQEMRSFLMLYLNLSFIVSWASVLLTFKLQFSVHFHCPFWQECMVYYVWSSYKLHMQSYTCTNQWQRKIACTVQKNM